LNGSDAPVRSLQGGSRWILFALFSVMVASLGDVYLAKAMHPYGDIRVNDLSSAIHLVVLMFSNARVWFALVFLTAYFVLWLIVLSKLELSIAVPVTASNYLYNAFLCQHMLGEVISARRWLGICIIVVGVVLVTRSTPPPPEAKNNS
jgi:drug/metabolite transporter (DMT)-like permease